jgi:hypothetical protein
MGTVCRTGVPGFFIGNSAENVRQHVDCSSLAVKPKGFVTPVKSQAIRTGVDSTVLENPFAKVSGTGKVALAKILVGGCRRLTVQRLSVRRATREPAEPRCRHL